MGLGFRPARGETQLGRLAYQVIVGLTVLGLAWIGPPIAASNAAVPVPQVKPEPPDLILDATQSDTYRDAFKQARRGNWSQAKGLAQKGKHDAASALISWLYLRDQNSGADFKEIVGFLERYPDWPYQTDILRNAEKAMPSSLKPSQVISWFAGQEPLTGEGQIRLGEAHIEQGDEKYGAAWIRKAWADFDFRRSEEQRILTRYSEYLEGQAHADRLNRLLWDQQMGAAKRVLPHVDPDFRALANARLALMSGAAAEDDILSSVPDFLLNDAGLIYDRVRYHLRRGSDDKAQAILRTVPQSATELHKPDKWWRQRHLMAREALDTGLYEIAYEIAEGHGMKEGADFAEAEWLAGWIALRFLDKPKPALIHFQTLYDGVNFPVSKARAAYWSGRAAEEMGKDAEAEKHYREGVRHPTTFYGQLSAQRINEFKTLLSLHEDPVPDDYDREEFLKDDLIEVVQVLAELGQDRLVRTFLFHMADTRDNAKELYLLGNLAMDLGYSNYGVRISKKALKKNIILPSLAYPVIDIPELPASAKPAEPALVLGLSRQESEFNTGAISHAGARGLMQLMPGTAKIVARQHHLPYAKEWLTSRPEYNAQLGTAHLGDLIKSFDGSYIMAIAAYNAGASRVRQWIAEYGDPRLGRIDPIDWIESIPYRETRNYVQRVLENTQVYRGRLAQENGLEFPVLTANDVARTEANAPSIPEFNYAQLVRSYGGAISPAASTTTTEQTALMTGNETPPPATDKEGPRTAQPLPGKVTLAKNVPQESVGKVELLYNQEEAPPPPAILDEDFTPPETRAAQPVVPWIAIPREKPGSEAVVAVSATDEPKLESQTEEQSNDQSGEQANDPDQTVAEIALPEDAAPETGASGDDLAASMASTVTILAKPDPVQTHQWELAHIRPESDETSALPNKTASAAARLEAVQPSDLPQKESIPQGCIRFVLNNEGESFCADNTEVTN